MTKNGVIKRWDMAKGFGFIRAADMSADVFFHISAFRSNAALVPHEGMAVRFEDVHMGGKGPRAVQVQPVVDKRIGSNADLAPGQRATQAKEGKPLALAPMDSRRPGNSRFKNAVHSRRTRSLSAPAPKSNLLPFVLVLAVWIGLLIFGALSQRLSLWFLSLLVLLNIATLFAYAFDKNAAERGWWRTQETTLHLFAFAGG